MPQELNTGQQPPRHQPKPLRLRSACNECNVAKVRCSGEHEGCARCKALRLGCIYTESRVGKVQGSRPRRRNADHRPRSAGFGAVPEGDSEDTILAHPALAPVQSASPSEAPQPHGQLLWAAASSWNDNTSLLEESFFGGYEAMLEDDTGVSSMAASVDRSVDSAEYAHPPAHAGFPLEPVPTTAPAAAAGETHGHTRDGHVAETGRGQGRLPIPASSTSAREPACLLTPSTWSASGQTQSFPRHQPSAEAPRGPSQRSVDAATDSAPVQAAQGGDFPPRLDGRCVLACVRILGTLENYLLSELRVLDLILGAVRKANQDLRKLVELQRQSRNDRCIILFTAIMFQLIDLLEVGSQQPLLYAEDDLLGELASGGRLSSSHTAFAPAFSSAGFSVGTEEQRQWRAGLICDECRQVGEILDSIKTLARLGPKEASMAPEAAEQRVSCLKGLERRLRNLYERM